jgi:hypothetical protein
MDQIAVHFSDLFGKDVIYNPLTVEEVSRLPFPTAPAMAQMCQFLGDPRSLQHDLKATAEVSYPKRCQTFEDWLLTHSDSAAFKLVGLDFDAPEILCVTVFGALSREGVSVVKGLLNDSRKHYMIRATTRRVDSEEAKAVQALDPERIELVRADFDDVESCHKAADGADGAFLVTDFYEEACQDVQVELQHAKNVIDACEASHSVRHLVFSTKESIEDMNQMLGLDISRIDHFDAKAQAAAYARTKKLSVTYILMPCYTELFFERMEKRTVNNMDKYILTLPLRDDTKVMCMSVEDLGPAVANVFDSYQVYAGHEIGLVTDFVSVKELTEIMQSALNEDVVLETDESAVINKDTYMKDLGQIFSYMSHTDAVKKRHSVAMTMKLVPSALPLRKWIEQNVDSVDFREKLGLR